MTHHDYSINADNPAEVAHWTISADTITVAWTNVLFSLVGYVLFAVILYSSYGKGVLRKHVHDVFLILIFACFTDVVELRMHLLTIFDLQHRTIYMYMNLSPYKYVPTTTAMCTLVTYLFYTHFLITYVEAIVSIYRFAVQFCKKTLPISFIYKCLGIVFAFKALLLLATLQFGEPQRAGTYCTKAYQLETPIIISNFIWAATILIAPLLSSLLILKGFVRKQQDSGVSLFILLSSLSMAAFVGLALVRGFLMGQGAASYDLYRFVFMVTAKVQDFRFLLLCMLAIAVVSDIRDAVMSTTMAAIRMLFGLQHSPKSITNRVFMAEVESKSSPDSKPTPYSDLMLI